MIIYNQHGRDNDHQLSNIMINGNRQALQVYPMFFFNPPVVHPHIMIKSIYIIIHNITQYK